MNIRKKQEEEEKQYKTYGGSIIRYEIKEHIPRKESKILNILKYSLIGTVQKFFEVLSRICFFLGFLIPLGIIYFIWKLFEGEAFTFQVISTTLTPLIIHFFGYVTGFIADHFEGM